MKNIFPEQKLLAAKKDVQLATAAAQSADRVAKTAKENAARIKLKLKVAKKAFKQAKKTAKKAAKKARRAQKELKAALDKIIGKKKKVGLPVAKRKKKRGARKTAGPGRPKARHTKWTPPAPKAVPAPTQVVAAPPTAEPSSASLA